MIIHAYILSYNEQEIIAKTLDHYCRFCSRVFLMDNMSNDRTLEIARQFAQVTVIPWVDETRDIRLLTRMKARTYYDYSRAGGRHTSEVADWIIACDADELLYHPDVAAVLSRYQMQGVTVPQVTGFDMIDRAEIDPNQSLVDQYRCGIRAPHMDKRIVFACDFDMRFSRGAHPRGPGFELMLEEYNYKTSEDAEFALLHFKFVGNRAYNVARNNIEKAPVKESGYAGTTQHYKATLDGNYDPRENFPNPPRVIKDNGCVAFTDFDPSTGDLGDQVSMRAVRGRYTDILKRVTDSLANRDLEGNINECIQLMSMARDFRPKGEHIKRKLKEYKSVRTEIGGRRGNGWLRRASRRARKLLYS
ncbi:MAG: glycosyltransferase family 2 protein [Pseudomonadota bacterium]